MKKWYFLFNVENRKTEWKQKIWIFEDLTRKQLIKKKNEGWRVSGDSQGEDVRGV